MLRPIAGAFAILLASCAPITEPRTAIGRELANVANPSAVIATELAFARAARERGQWTAFRDYAAEDAVMFVPQAVKAQEWLKGRADPAQPVQWQPHQVWMSCDGTLAVTQGAAQWPDGRPGRFVTVWERQSDGRYRWVVDAEEPLEAPLAAPDFIRSEVAQCHGPGEVSLPVHTADFIERPLSEHHHKSRDGSFAVVTLGWTDRGPTTHLRISRADGSGQLFSLSEDPLGDVD